MHFRMHKENEKNYARAVSTKRTGKFFIKKHYFELIFAYIEYEIWQEPKIFPSILFYI
jgi:hypothetical protein